MTIFPHKQNPYKPVPLLRKFECQDELPFLESKSERLMGILWESLVPQESIEPLFHLHRLLKYTAKGGDRHYSAPFLHHFYVPTNDGMSWIKDRYEKKYGLSISLVHSKSELLEKIAYVQAKEEPHFEPFILSSMDHAVLHVTPCIVIKNQHGSFFLHLDSMGGDSSVISQKDLRALLPEDVIIIFNAEPRQKDGFSCRLDAFTIIKEIHKFFIANRAATPLDIFCKLEKVESLENSFTALLKGAYLKTAQKMIDDERKKELVVGARYTLEELQSGFTTRYIRSLELAVDLQHEIASSCVYLQCKALKYVKMAYKEIEDFDNRYKNCLFSLTEDF
jgi:hypothetical protein